MMYYAHYDDSGFIVAVCGYDFMDANLSVMEIGETPIKPSEYYVFNSLLRKIPDRPNAVSTFDRISQQWVDQRILADVRITQWTAIKAARDAALQQALITPYGTFDCNAQAQANIINALLLLQNLAALGTPGSVNFTLADNTTIPLNVAQMVQVGLLLGAQTEAAYDKGVAKRAAINAASTVAAVEAITWESTP